MTSRIGLTFSLIFLIGVVAIAQEARRPGGANTSFTTREFRATNGQPLKFSLFVPTDRGTEKLPLVLCLHGAGGNTVAANLLAAPELQKKHPCVILAPGCDTKKEGWVDAPVRRGVERRGVTQELLEVLDSIVKEVDVDFNRIYVTGQSLGGIGSWGLIAKHANRFAAAVPVCGIWTTDDAAKMNGVAIWAFHGDQDPTVPVSGSREMIAALKKAGVTPEPRYTEFPGVGHGSWTPAYATPDLWDWVFAQRRTTTAAPK